MNQATEVVACPVCNSDDAVPVRTAGDIVKCEHCDLVYLRTRPTVKELELQYQSYASTPGSHMKLPSTIQEIRSTGLRRDQIMADVLAFVGGESKIRDTDYMGWRLLDIGSGWGTFLFNARSHGFRVNGIEICREMANFAESVLGIQTEAKQLEQCEFLNETIRVVSLLHSLEHLPNTATALEYIHRILEPNGLICGIVPNFGSYASETTKDRWMWLDPVVHYVHWTTETLEKTLWQFGFHMQKMYTATGDYERRLLPSGPTLAKLEQEGRGEEIRWFATKL